MADTTRRALRHCGKHVYAPWCDACQSDRENSYATGRLDEGWCARCYRVLHLDAREQYAALEPQRLDDRMAEIKKTGTW